MVFPTPGPSCYSCFFCKVHVPYSCCGFNDMNLKKSFLINLGTNLFSFETAVDADCHMDFHVFSLIEHGLGKSQFNGKYFSSPKYPLSLYLKC